MLTRLGARLKPIMDRASQLWLSVTGLGAFAAAGYTVNLTTGLIVTGVSALVLEWRADARG